jgi:dTDP-4-dehydrorhamnose reductase
VAIGARDTGAELISISTDYVFDGSKPAPYVETDRVNPINYYGQTKLLGEQAVERDVKSRYICRTSWLFGAHGKNFVDTILRLAREKDTLDVVDDQHGSPTYTKDFCVALELLIGSRHYGTYHISNSDSCTWFQFAQEIVLLAGLGAKVNPTTSDKFVRPAKRPENSVLDNSKFQGRFNFVMPSWKDALKRYLKERGMLLRG